MATRTRKVDAMHQIRSSQRAYAGRLECPMYEALGVAEDDEAWNV
jgi:hypothetical protein